VASWLDDGMLVAEMETMLNRKWMHDAVAKTGKDVIRSVEG